MENGFSPQESLSLNNCTSSSNNNSPKHPQQQQHRLSLLHHHDDDDHRGNAMSSHEKRSEKEDDVYCSTYNRQFPASRATASRIENAALAHYTKLRASSSLSPTLPDQYETTSRSLSRAVQEQLGASPKARQDCRPAPWPQESDQPIKSAPFFATTTNRLLLSNHRYVPNLVEEEKEDPAIGHAAQQQGPSPTKMSPSPSLLGRTVVSRNVEFRHGQDEAALAASRVVVLSKPTRAHRPAPRVGMLSWNDVASGEEQLQQQQEDVLLATTGPSVPLLKGSISQSPQRTTVSPEQRLASRPAPCQFHDTLRLFGSSPSPSSSNSLSGSNNTAAVGGGPRQQHRHHLPDIASKPNRLSSELLMEACRDKKKEAQHRRRSPSSPTPLVDVDRSPTSVEKFGKKVIWEERTSAAQDQNHVRRSHNNNESPSLESDWKTMRQPATYVTTNDALLGLTLSLSKKRLLNF